MSWLYWETTNLNILFWLFVNCLFIFFFDVLYMYILVRETNWFEFVWLNNRSRDGDESSVIGWPPIKSWRKKHCYQNYSHNRTVENQCGRGLNSTYVKVKMEGVGIGRKVDLSLFHSYQALTNTLIAMFGKCEFIF